MLEVLLVTGPLGSGKTTVVNRLLKAELAQGRRVAVLINEFGAVSVDGLLVESERPELAGIANLVDGCACCSLRGDVVADPGRVVRPARCRAQTGGAGDHRPGRPHRPGGPGAGAGAGRPDASGGLPHGGLGPDAPGPPGAAGPAAAPGGAGQPGTTSARPTWTRAWPWPGRARSARPSRATRSGPRAWGVAPGHADPWAGVLPPVRLPDLPATFAEARALTLRWDHPVDPEGLEALFLRPPGPGRAAARQGHLRLRWLAGAPRRQRPLGLPVGRRPAGDEPAAGGARRGSGAAGGGGHRAGAGLAGLEGRAARSGAPAGGGAAQGGAAALEGRRPVSAA